MAGGVRTSLYKVLRRANQAANAVSLAYQKRAISAILRSPGPPTYLDSQATFDELQRRFPPVPEYGYDALSTWRRGFERARWLLENGDLVEPGRDVLEVACGDGMVGYALAGYGHRVILHDLEDWRDPRARRLPFVASDACRGLGLASAAFDLICSYNAFEHLPDPAAALAELVRVCRPGGLIYLSFGPLYASRWGLHAHRTLNMPFPQYLFSAEFLAEKLKQLGIRDLGGERAELQFVNGWRLAQYERIWRRDDCDIVELKHRTVEPGLLQVIRDYPQAFSGRGLAYEDVATAAIDVMLRRK